LQFVDWNAVFEYLKFPIYLKPAYGGGWKNVYHVKDPDAFFAAYDESRDLVMMAQEAIDFDDYFRIYTLGRERVHIMRYDPRAPQEHRYVSNGAALEPALAQHLRADALALSATLGYDLNTVELALRDGVPYAIDFTNPAPDADLSSVGAQNFAWIVRNMAELLVERVRRPRPFELSGSWPAVVAAQRGAHA
jgi:glutathione synthase/RimK-type ligase-like ATP-grasp enzyme